MRVNGLAVEGAYVFTPEEFPDDRGRFLSHYQESVFGDAVGRPLFPVAQASSSVSRRGVVRGLHYTATPPGTAKYVHCPRGRALDVVLDVRVGSPTFGVWDSVVLDSLDFRAVYFPLGVAHLFVALEDDTVMSYLLSREYVAADELAISPLDPGLDLPVPGDLTPILSERDRAAPRLEEARAAGLLPDYRVCAEIEAGSRV
ncbi:dTDP-4-keto-6-deoxy-D-glucose epimerase [Microbispora cellulosiformans]|uniref:dTDP-4-keto-6-deoxy-D-glucose epimerase n=1 Tax=Microbispora cellulosiformans TaxID=2614688 RepID=A0A5J5K1I6_9ACTN|nr:dTDP-4-dehydrorhamnose 3,5-epimerase family protein [Microbispora cellulosiformans]KAA9377598.1 dTDP-4-keto-6-deoxy-D-glucose epimerase [Microbispora cellulosiformans]